MKKIVFALLLIFGGLTVQAQDAELKWMSIDEALEAQKKDPKPIMMDVYTDWCGPCKYLDKTTFHDPAFVAYVKANYYPVKFNGEGTTVVNYKGKKYANPGYNPDRKGRNAAHEFTMFLQVQGYPSVYVFDKNGEIKSPLIGYRTSTELIDELKKIN